MISSSAPATEVDVLEEIAGQQVAAQPLVAQGAQHRSEHRALPAEITDDELMEKCRRNASWAGLLLLKIKTPTIPGRIAEST